MRDSHSEVRALSPPSFRTRERSPCRVMCRLGARLGPRCCPAPRGPFPRRSRWIPLGDRSRSPSAPGCPVEAGCLEGARGKCRAFIYTGASGPAATDPPPPGVVQGLRCFPLGRLSPGSGEHTGGRRAVDYRPISLILFSSVLGNTFFIHIHKHTSCHPSFFQLHSVMYHACGTAVKDDQKTS